MAEKIVHSFEAGRRGKPDEFEAGLAHLIGSYFLTQDQDSRFDIRVTGGHPFKTDRPLVRIGGEISQSLFDFKGLETNIAQIVKWHYNDVHKTDVSPDFFEFVFGFKPQNTGLATNGHAGDSGNPIAVAYREGPNFLPYERFAAVAIRDLLDAAFQHSISALGGYSPRVRGLAAELQGLRADGKVSVTAEYHDEPHARRFSHLRKIVIAAEHERSLPVADLRSQVQRLVGAYLLDLQEIYPSFTPGVPDIVINGLGDWNDGGWKIDEGSREAKPHRDGFATYGCNEDSFSGEDPSKPSGTGTFLARYIAVQLVAHGLAGFARVGLEYTIGESNVDLDINLRGPNAVSQGVAEEWVRENIPLRISDAVQLLNLRDPGLYEHIADESDFFQSANLPWNQKGDYTAPPKNTPTERANPGFPTC